MENKEQPRIKDLKSKAMALKPCVQIGKKGLTEESIKEIKEQLKKKGIVKIKLLKSGIECLGGKTKKSIANDIALKTGSKLVSQVGFTAVYHKKQVGNP
ncbi:YhbY family RNA-binding protein [Thermoproteota archaeon]